MQVFAGAEILQSAAHFVVIVVRRWIRSCGGDGNKAVFTRDSKRLLLLQSHQPLLHKAQRWWGNNTGSLKKLSEKPLVTGIQSVSQLCTFIMALLAAVGTSRLLQLASTSKKSITKPRSMTGQRWGSKGKREWCEFKQPAGVGCRDQHSIAWLSRHRC